LAGHPQATLIEIYVEALLVNEELADLVWEAWDKGEIDDQGVCIAWMLIACVPDKRIQIESIQPMPSCSFSMPVKFAAKP